MTPRSTTAPADADLVEAIERYRTIGDLPTSDVERAVSSLFVPNAIVESDELAVVLDGHRSISAHLLADVRPATRRVTEVQWAHHTARWCWISDLPDGPRRGMDVVRFDLHRRRIELVVRFAGLLPRPR